MLDAADRGILFKALIMWKMNFLNSHSLIATSCCVKKLRGYTHLVC